VLGEKLSVKILLSDYEERYFNGHVTTWSYRGTRDERAIYHVTLRPWLWMLNFISDCRVFNKKSALDIVKSIFSKYAVADFDLGAVMASDYPPYEYLVQYRETDFNLVCRLLQHEGIYFFFSHGAQNHTLTLADGPGAHSTSPGYEIIPYRPPTTNAKQMEAHFDRCSFGQGILAKSYRHTDYDFQKANRGPANAALLSFGNSLEQEELYRFGETFEYPGQYLTYDRGKVLASVRLDEAYAPSQMIEADGNPLGLGIGDVFTLPNPPWDNQSAKFMVVSAHYDLRVPDQRSTAGEDSEQPYHAHYTLIPDQAQYRPRRTAKKPIVHGPQTAVVVGQVKTAYPDPEEIETDSYGRVRVRFHWERIGDQHPDIRGKKAAGGQQDEFSQEESDTCYVRVAQAWAGNRWGSMFIPRIGQEVVVEFLEGDPDRPLITGSVYNNVNMPPYDLPKHMTQSGIKSRSTKGGNFDNFNEIRFEDLKGKEELHVQAEKDMSTLVKHNQSTSVGADRSVSVGGNHSVSVTGTQTTTVTKKETQTYKAEREMKVTGTNLDEITGAHTGKYHAGRTETVEKGDTLEVMGSNKTVTVHGEYNNVADTQYQVTNGSNVILMKGSDIVVNNSDCEIMLSGSDTTVTAKASVTIKCGSASLSMKSDGTIEITGVKVKVGNANNNAAFEPAGTTINGVKITSASVGMHEISGALIKVG